MMKLIREDLDSLGIKMDNYFSEKSVYSERKIDLTIEQLSKRGLIYEGVLEPPKGKKLEKKCRIHLRRMCQDVFGVANFENYNEIKITESWILGLHDQMLQYSQKDS